MNACVLRVCFGTTEALIHWHWNELNIFNCTEPEFDFFLFFFFVRCGNFSVLDQSGGELDLIHLSIHPSIDNLTFWHDTSIWECKGWVFALIWTEWLYMMENPVSTKQKFFSKQKTDTSCVFCGLSLLSCRVFNYNWHLESFVWRLIGNR